MNSPRKLCPSSDPRRFAAVVAILFASGFTAFGTLVGTDQASNTSIWSSTGAANTGGSVTIQDTALINQTSGRFLRLKVSH